MSHQTYELFVLASVAWLAHGIWSDWLLTASASKGVGATRAQVLLAFLMLASGFTLARVLVAVIAYQVACLVIGWSS